MSAPSDELRPLREQGVDLDDEAALGPYDLAGMKAALKAETGGGGGGGPGGGLVAGGAIAAAALIALGLWTAAGGPDPVPVTPAPTPAEARLSAPVPEAPTPAPAMPADPPVDRARAAVQALPAPAPAPASAPPSAAASTPVDSPEAADDLPELPPPGTADALPEPTPTPQAQGSEAAPPAESGAPAGGDLDAQNAVFARGERALEAGDWAGAGAAFQEYLERWPEGVFRDEALVAVLDLTIRAERWDHVELLAGELATLPTLAPRHPELRRLRAEALVHLDRCDEALALAESLERAEAGLIRRSCR